MTIQYIADETFDAMCQSPFFPADATQFPSTGSAGMKCPACLTPHGPTLADIICCCNCFTCEAPEMAGTWMPTGIGSSASFDIGPVEQLIGGSWGEVGGACGPLNDGTCFVGTPIGDHVSSVYSDLYIHYYYYVDVFTKVLTVYPVSAELYFTYYDNNNISNTLHPFVLLGYVCKDFTCEGGTFTLATSPPGFYVYPFCTCSSTPPDTIRVTATMCGSSSSSSS